MKIVQVSPMYAPVLGGAEHHLQALSEGLAVRGHEVTVLTANVRNGWDLYPPYRDGHLPEAEVINGVNVIRVPPDGGLAGKALKGVVELKGGWRSLRSVFGEDGFGMLCQGPQSLAMIHYLIGVKADIVSSMNWFYSPAYYVYLARKLKRFPLVGIPLFHTVQPWCNRKIYDKMLASCDVVVVNTSHEGQYARQRGATQVEVGGVGIDPKVFDNRNGHEIRARYGLGNFPVIGFVGRQDEKKGAHKVVAAMRNVWRWNPEVRLVLAGPRSPQKKDIEALINDLPWSQRKQVIDIGAFDERDKGSLFASFDVFAMPSTEESFGIAYLESWLCKKPVIGARIGSTQCVIDEGVDGLLADPNDPADIGRAMIDLLSDEVKREKMGNRGYAKTLATFTWEKVVDRVEGLYLDLLDKKRKYRWR